MGNLFTSFKRGNKVKIQKEKNSKEEGVKREDEDKSKSFKEDVDDALTTGSKVVDAKEMEEEFIPTAEFQPVIPLPPLIDVGLLDADENLIYETRAKLYQLTSGEEGDTWGDRGTGAIKIVQQKATRKARIIMRRDQVNNVAANHNISEISGIKHHENEETGRRMLIWGCIDHTYGKPSKEVFLSKFRSAEICSEFKKHVDRFMSMIEEEDIENKPPGTDEESKRENKNLAKPMHEESVVAGRSAVDDVKAAAAGNNQK